MKEEQKQVKKPAGTSDPEIGVGEFDDRPEQKQDELSEGLLLSPDLLELGINEHYWDSMPEGGERKVYAAIITNLIYAIPRIEAKDQQRIKELETKLEQSLANHEAEKGKELEQCEDMLVKAKAEAYKEIGEWLDSKAGLYFGKTNYHFISPEELTQLKSGKPIKEGE